MADHGDAASLKALRRRVAELEKLLAERNGGDCDETAVTNRTEVAEDRPRPGGGPQEWLENLKKRDPERYVQMTNRFAQWRLRRNEDAQRKMEFLASVDTSRMGENARQNHEALQDMIVRMDELDERMQDPDLTQDERRELFEEMRQSGKELHNLNNRERRNLIEATARAAGLKGAAVKEVSATIQEVINATDGGHGFGPPPRGGGHPPHP